MSVSPDKKKNRESLESQSKRDQKLIRTQPRIKTIDHPRLSFPCPQINQSSFTGSIILQAAHIDPKSETAQYKYQLSNLENYVKKYTHFPLYKMYEKVGHYYSTFITKPDLFLEPKMEHYRGGKVCLIVKALGDGEIRYPNGDVAIKCTPGQIRDHPMLLGRR